MNTCQLIHSLILYAMKNELIAPEDKYVIRNQLMDAMQIYEWDDCAEVEFSTIDELLDALLDDACNRDIIHISLYRLQANKMAKKWYYIIKCNLY